MEMKCGKDEIRNDFNTHGVKEILASYMMNPYAEDLINDYIQSLENILVFMCQSYEEQEKVLFELAKEGNDALHKTPRIQGMANTISIAQIADVEFEKPPMNFMEIKDEIIRRRKN